MPVLLQPAQRPVRDLKVQGIFHRTLYGLKAVEPYNGTEEEDWRTWILQFQAVADSYQWTEEEKARALVISLRGEAATFALQAVTPETRADYKGLVSELAFQYAGAECTKVFCTQYRNLCQEPGQSEQELAAAIRVLHSKAYPGRDKLTSQEDMVSKFLEALLDDQQRVAIEFPQMPDTLKKAVKMAVHYREAARKAFGG